jgi:hypothetical protein
VLKAFDPALHRPVAIKVLAAEYAASAAARKRFAREAQAAAAVVHDHVVPVHAVDADATPPYLVMAFIPGRSLQQRIDHTGPLELKEILRIGTQTASGLAAAHAQGLVHRDIKPANIMLENGVERVRITDFGLARAVDDASVTQKGAVAGTPQYMAPEQARGETVDQRADLFALGSTLYAMCTGEAPFRGDSTLAVLRQVCDAEPPPVRSLNPDVPVWLEGVIRKLHAKDPAQRFQSAAEVADLLGRCLAHVQQPDRQPLPRLADELGRQVPGPRRARRSRWASLEAVACVVCVLGGAAAVFGPGLGAKFQRGAPEETAASAPTVVPPHEPFVPMSDVMMPDEAFAGRASQLKRELSSLEQSLTLGPPGDGGLETKLAEARWRAELLRRELTPAAEASPDSVDAQLSSIRRQVELMKRELGVVPE